MEKFPGHAHHKRTRRPKSTTLNHHHQTIHDNIEHIIMHTHRCTARKTDSRRVLQKRCTLILTGITSACTAIHGCNKRLIAKLINKSINQSIIYLLHDTSAKIEDCSKKSLHKKDVLGSIEHLRLKTKLSFFTENAFLTLHSLFFK